MWVTESSNQGKKDLTNLGRIAVISKLKPVIFRASNPVDFYEIKFKALLRNDLYIQTCSFAG